MTKEEVMTAIAAVTSTLEELGNPVSPASSIYLALGMDLGRYDLVAKVLSDAGLANVTSETIQLTEKGLDIGRQCSALI